MADNIQRSTGRPTEYRFDRGGMPAEMGPYVGIVVNNVDNTRSGRLQVWIEQFGATEANGTPNLTDPSVWRTVRYISPFYGATPQSGANGVGTYPGNRNSYGMWFTPPDLGTKVLCFFVSGDPTVGGYYLGCIPEDGINHMIPAIGASSNYQANNSAQQQALAGATAAPVTEINDIDPKFTDNPKFFDLKKPVQSSVESVLFQQGLQKDPIRGPIKSSAQRESPSNCYGISTPGKPIYQGGLTGGASARTLKNKLETGQVRLQDIAVIGREGGHTFVMDDGDLEGKDTLVRIRTAKGHQITMSDDGDAFFITHANGQTWIELGKQGTVDVYSTNSINLRTQGVLNFHADQGINMYSGGYIRMKSLKTSILESTGSLSIGAKTTILNSQTFTGIKSDGTLALESKFGSWKSNSALNFKGKVINLNGAQTTSVPAVAPIVDYKLADTSYVAGQGWVVKQGALSTIATRAPTHEPYPGHGLAADIKVDLNPITTATAQANSSASQKYDQIITEPVVDGVKIENVATEPNLNTDVGPLNSTEVQAMTAQTAQYHASQFPPYDDDGNLQPGWAINDETGQPYYNGTDVGNADRGVGKYGQSVDSLVGLGYLKSGVPNLINSGISPATVLNSNSVWTGQYGISNLLSYLQNPTIQTIAQVGLMASSYLGLFNAGVLRGTEAPGFVAAFLQPATEYGVDNVVQWVDGFADEATTNVLEVSARQGQYSVDFVDAYSAELSATSTANAITDATNRTAIDQAMADIIGDPKVPVPQYTDTEVALTGDTTTVIQADGIVRSIPVTQTTTGDDGTFHFAPGNKQG